MVLLACVDFYTELHKEHIGLQTDDGSRVPNIMQVSFGGIVWTYTDYE